MRTKTLLITALLGLAAVPALRAQTAVYSVNAVGYVTQTYTNGEFYLVANPLNAVTNTINGIFGTNLPLRTVYFHFDPVSQSYQSSTFKLGAWDQPDMPFAPGGGGFLKTGGTSGNTTFTYVGDVPQGSLNNPIPAGFSIRSSQVPQSLPLSDDPAGGATLGFPAVNKDVIYFFRSGQYDTYSFKLGAWDRVPVPAVGESFFVKKFADTNWARAFSVNQ